MVTCRYANLDNDSFPFKAQSGSDERNGTATSALRGSETNKVTDMELQFVEMCAASQ